jgi:hypothetical protein
LAHIRFPRLSETVEYARVFGAAIIFTQLSGFSPACAQGYVPPAVLKSQNDGRHCDTSLSMRDWETASRACVDAAYDFEDLATNALHASDAEHSVKPSDLALLLIAEAMTWAKQSEALGHLGKKQAARTAYNRGSGILQFIRQHGCTACRSMAVSALAQYPPFPVPTGWGAGVK